jgi:hypothetical protein
MSPVAILTALLIVTLATPLHMGGVSANIETVKSSFSIIQITDTQFPHEENLAFYTKLTNWIITKNLEINIKMVIHTGDIVNEGENPYEWVNANSSMSSLLDAGIPYTWDAGNHDQNMTGKSYSGNPNGDWMGSKYLAFNSTYLASQSYWVSDICNGKNTATQFSFGNYNFLVINLEFHANESALNWMTDLINTHPNYNVIVAAHSYLNGIQHYGYPTSPDSPQWENKLTTMLNNYPNVFLTMSGHYVPTIYSLQGDAETSNYTRINTREETFFNRQHADGDAGADSARIFTFDLRDPNNMSIQTSTLDIYSSVWKNDTWNLFSFPVNLINSTFLQTPYPLATLVPAQISVPASAIILESTPRPKVVSTPSTEFANIPASTPESTPKSTEDPKLTPKSESIPIQKFEIHSKIIEIIEVLLQRLFSFVESLVHPGT